MLNLIKAFKQFWKEIMLKLEPNQLVYVILQVKLEDNSILSLTSMQTISKNYFVDTLNIFKAHFNIRSEDYKDKKYVQLIFCYHILSNNEAENSQNKIKLNNVKINKNQKISFNFSGYKLPTNSDFMTWGRLIFSDNNNFIIAKNNSKLTYSIVQTSDGNLCKLLDKHILLLEFTDIIINKEKGVFTRSLKNHNYYFENNTLILKTNLRKVKYMQPIKPDNKITNKFFTLDMETRTINGIITPVCISIYNGLIFNSFYLSDYKDSDTMLLFALRSLLKTNNNNSKVYVHNLSNFDGIFLIRVLSNILNTKLNPVMKNGRMINLNLSWFTENKDKRYSIDFRDSLLLLPTSLRKLAIAFNVELKSFFPFSFLNKIDTSLLYEGIVPNYDFYSDISLNEYNKITNALDKNQWNLKSELIKYCEQDCRTLWLIINNFNLMIYSKYKLNIHRFPTLPSLTFGIWQCHYLKDLKVPIISGPMYKDIKLSYTGGHTDLYKPQGKNIYLYDVNSLYPHVMTEFDMPIGIAKYFEGNILKLFPNAIGFFECEVTTPTNMYRPLLQTKVKTTNGLRTISPLGIWTDTFFSEEIREYMKYGYKFKIIKGYTFERGNIFKDYILDLYKIKQSHNSTEPMYLISKLLMNSLYGKFGMDPNMPSHHIINNDETSNYMNKDNTTITSLIDLNNNKSLISLVKTNLSHDEEDFINVNISIASAITSYARIYMSKYLSNNLLDIYYTDTDSIFTKTPLDPQLLGTNLGQFKLEKYFSEIIFLAPKVYIGKYLINNVEHELTKIKGFKGLLSYAELNNLLFKHNSIKLQHNK